MRNDKYNAYKMNSLELKILNTAMTTLVALEQSMENPETDAEKIQLQHRQYDLGMALLAILQESEAHISNDARDEFENIKAKYSIQTLAVSVNDDGERQVSNVVPNVQTNNDITVPGGHMVIAFKKGSFPIGESPSIDFYGGDNWFTSNEKGQLMFDMSPLKDAALKDIATKACAVYEKQLEILFKKIMITSDDKNTQARIYNALHKGGSLYDLGQKINLANSLGLIDNYTYTDLTNYRNIRNKCGHGYRNCEFTDDNIISLLNNMPSFHQSQPDAAMSWRLAQTSAYISSALDFYYRVANKPRIYTGHPLYGKIN